MTTQPEALRLAGVLEALNAGKKLLPCVGGETLGTEVYRIRLSGSDAGELLDAAAELRRLYAEIERLRQENRLWYSRAVALFWKGDAGNITLERIQSAAKEIDAALQEVKP